MPPVNCRSDVRQALHRLTSILKLAKKSEWLTSECPNANASLRGGRFLARKRPIATWDRDEEIFRALGRKRLLQELLETKYG